MFKRYELHNHTIESDALISCRELIDHMVADKVDCFAITDHNTVSGQPIIRKILAEENLPVQCAYGMEYTTYYGHIVCPALEQYVPWDSINRRNPELLFEACKKADAVTGVAHPFSYGDPFARGCRFEMEIRDFTHVDYIEVINNPEPLHEVNGPGIEWWESLVLKGEKLAACAGMDLHELTGMAMKYATYAEGEEGGDAVAELKTAIQSQRTWISNGMLLVWEIEDGIVRFSLTDANKPGFIHPEKYVMTLKNASGTREYEITAGGLTLPLSELSDIEIPKLYGGKAVLDNLICIAPVIRK
jgi:hypothetical protein